VVIKGASRRSIGFWAGHLRDTKANDRAEVVETRGLIADDLRGMMREMQDGASATRCRNFMYVASFNPCENETLTERQWERAFEIFEKERGMPEGQRRVVIEHEKKGRVHRHVVWDRIDTETMRAFPDSLDLKVCEAAKHKIEQELDLQRTPGLLHRDPALPPPQRNPPSWEMFRGQKSGIDPRDLKAEVTAIFRESHNAADFMAGLEAHGYQLCQGDRRGFVILDDAGHTHSLARRIDGITTKQLNAFMDGIDRAALPSVSQAREQHQERKIAGLEADRATVQRAIQTAEREGLLISSLKTAANDNEAQRIMEAYGYDASNPATLKKWRELEIKVIAEKIIEKDRFREMDKHMWNQADTERRIAAKEERIKEEHARRDIDPERDRG
jgi:hypothetical protein